MKIIAIGLGQCGCNVVDAFYGANKHSESFFGRRAEILIDAFAANTTNADLKQLKHIPDDSFHRIRVGGDECSWHGVGKLNQVAAEIFEKDHGKIISSIKATRRFYEAEAYMVVASAGGGTGSGGISRIVKELKEGLIHKKPVYGMVVLPFRHEEIEKNSLAVFNTATCIRTLYEVADAVIVVDNERFVEIDRSLAGKMEKINARIAASFYDLFCAGEEGRRKYIGRKVVEAGDIKECIKGLTTLGLGHVPLSVFRSLKKTFRGSQYLDDSKDEAQVQGALNEAVEKLCVQCDLERAGRIGCLVCGPKDVINEEIMGTIKRTLNKLAPEAIIRIGDYPRRAFDVTITLIAGDLGTIKRIDDIYERGKEVKKSIGDLEKKKEEQRKQMIEKGKDLPSLL